MKAKYKLLKYYLFLNLLFRIIKPEDELVSNNDIIQKAYDQGYNISDPENIFFNDICQSFSSENRKDVSLEYRRKYYFYPKGEQLIIINDEELNETFSEPERNNIFLCFGYFLKKDCLSLISLYYLLPIFSVQILGLFIILCFKYKDASLKTSEKYFEYMKGKNKKTLYNKKIINNNKMAQEIVVNTTDKINETNNNNTFQTLQEENENNNDSINNNNNDINTKEEIIKDENNEFPKSQYFFSQTIEKTNEEDSKNDELNVTGDFQHYLDENTVEDNEDNKIQNIKKINKDETYTFGGLKVDVTSQNKEEDTDKKNIIKTESETKKGENAQYIFSKMNRKNNYKPNYNIKSSQPKEIIYTKEELFYSKISVAILQDKRTFSELYCDYLSHCQIIFYLLPNYYIYEDKRLTILYYLLKIMLYYITILISFNDISIINKIYDNQFSFLDYFIKCSITIIIVNIISQILFFLTNSKKLYIRYNIKLNSSLIAKKRIIKYVLEDVFGLISQNVFWKLLILFFISIILFVITFFISICFCICYYNTQFLVLKSVIFCIIISQLFPFLLALIPAKIRYEAIKTKNNDLYLISLAVNSLFLP